MTKNTYFIAIIFFTTLAYSQVFASVDYIQPTALKNQYLSSIMGYPTKYRCPPQPVLETKSKCCSDNTISVSGSGTIQGSPDFAIVSAQLTASGKTVKQAISKLSTQVNTVIKILASNGLTEKNYQAISVNVYPNSSWINGASVVSGQIANQYIKIEIPQISPDGSNIGKLIDELATVNGIILNGLSFDIKNKTSIFFKARETAFKNAQTKALDYAVELGLTIGKVISVTDSSYTAPVTQQLDTSSMRPMAIKAQSSVPTQVNVGTIPIQYSVELVYSYC